MKYARIALGTLLATLAFGGYYTASASALHPECGGMPALLSAFGSPNHGLTAEWTGLGAGGQFSIAPETEVWNNKWAKYYNNRGEPVVQRSNWPVTFTKAGTNWRITFAELTPGLYRVNFTGLAYNISGPGPPDSSWECAGGTPESRYNVAVT